MLPKIIVFGVDVYPQYTKSEDSFNGMRYALTILEEGARTRQLNKVPKSRLIRLIRSYKPALLAVDNIYELAPNSSSMRHLFSTLPSETKVIQVTGSPKEAINLQEAALNHGLKPPSKISPIEESEACARLATLGIGSEVQILENETKILVCRDASLGPGGTSQSRYRRRIHVSILAVARKIEEALQRVGIDYDLFTEESDFGLERADFTVYAPRARLFGLVKSGHGNYIRIKVSPVYRNQIEFIPRERHKLSMAKNSLARKLILGVDPGTTCGLAVLTFESEPVHVGSHRGLSRGDIVRILMALGEAVIVAADVTPAPEFVERLAKTLNAIVFTPESLLEAAEKQDIAHTYAAKYDVELKDPHIRDAFVAAIKAFQHYKNKFEQIEVEVRKTGLNLPVDEVKALVVRGHSIQRAIALLAPKEPEKEEFETEETEDRTVPRETELKIRSLQKTVSFYKGQAKRLKDLVDRLTHTVKALESKISNLQASLETARNEEVRKIREEREYQVLQREIEVLRKQLNEAREEAEQYQKRFEVMRSYKELESKGEVVFLKPVEAFTKDGLEKAFQLYNIKMGDTIMLLDASGGGKTTSEEIAKRGVRAVIACTTMAHQAEDTLKAHNILVIPSKNLNVEWIEGYPYVKAGDLERAIKEMVELERAETDKTLQEIVDEYKRKRMKEIREAT